MGLMGLVDCIKEMGMTLDEFAYAISVPASTLRLIISGGDVSAPTTMLIRQTLEMEGLRWNGK